MYTVLQKCTHNGRQWGWGGGGGGGGRVPLTRPFVNSPVLHAKCFFVSLLPFLLQKVHSMTYSSGTNRIPVR